MTKQEMFDLAVRGLASQEWTQSRRIFDIGHAGCAYSGAGNSRCAWGWVDPTLSFEIGGVRTLREHKIGLAATLDHAQINFAADLQDGHDSGLSPETMLRNFIRLCESYELVWPADVPLVARALKGF